MDKLHLEGSGPVILEEGDWVDLQLQFFQVGQFPELAEHWQSLDIISSQFNHSKGLKFGQVGDFVVSDLIDRKIDGIQLREIRQIFQLANRTIGQLKYLQPAKLPQLLLHIRREDWNGHHRKVQTAHLRRLLPHLLADLAHLLNGFPLHQNGQIQLRA